MDPFGLFWSGSQTSQVVKLMYNDMTSVCGNFVCHFYLWIELAFVGPKRLFQIQVKLAILVYPVQL